MTRVAPGKPSIAGGTTSVALAVVVTLYGVVYVAMKTGPCMNPAVGIAFTLLELWQVGNPNGIYTYYAIPYTIGPAIGGALAGVFALMSRANHKSAIEEYDK